MVGLNCYTSNTSAHLHLSQKWVDGCVHGGMKMKCVRTDSLLFRIHIEGLLSDQFSAALSGNLVRSSKRQPTLCFGHLHRRRRCWHCRR